jgi:hypothetical protein
MFRVLFAPRLMRRLHLERCPESLLAALIQPPLPKHPISRYMPHRQGKRAVYLRLNN